MRVCSFSKALKFRNALMTYCFTTSKPNNFFRLSLELALLTSSLKSSIRVSSRPFYRKSVSNLQVRTNWDSFVLKMINLCLSYRLFLTSLSRVIRNYRSSRSRELPKKKKTSLQANLFLSMKYNSLKSKSSPYSSKTRRLPLSTFTTVAIKSKFSNRGTCLK